MNLVEAELGGATFQQELTTNFARDMGLCNHTHPSATKVWSFPRCKFVDLQFRWRTLDRLELPKRGTNPGAVFGSYGI